jgi:hypothetical protein
LKGNSQRAIWVLLCLLLIGCQDSVRNFPTASLPPPSVATPTSTLAQALFTITPKKSTVTSKATGHLTSQARPESIRPTPTSNSQPLTLLREADGFRIAAAYGGIGSKWIDSSHMIINWAPDINKRPNTTFLADLATLQLHELPISGTTSVIPSKDGKQAILTPDFGQPLGAALLDVSSGQVQTVFSLDATVPQWTDVADRSWTNQNRPANVDATWIDDDAFILKIGSGAKLEYQSPGKLLLVHLKSQEVQVLTQEGELAAVLPDGSLLLRTGWVDGPLEVLAPPYDAPPTAVTPGGPWTEVWSVSPNGQWVAWFEMEPLTHLGYRYLPQLPGGGIPPVKSLVFWEVSSGEVKRFPVDSAEWPYIGLFWRRDNSGVAFSANNWEHVSLRQITPNGQLTVLATYEKQGVIWTYAETDDGSLYYFAAGRPWVTSNFESFNDQLTAGLVRRFPDGQLKVISPRGLRISYLEASNQILVTDTSSTITVVDLGTDTVRERQYGTPPVSVQHSPDGQWVAYGSYIGPVHIVPIK